MTQDDLEIQRRARDWAAVNFPPTKLHLASKAWAAGYRQCLEDMKENGAAQNDSEKKEG